MLAAFSAINEEEKEMHVILHMTNLLFGTNFLYQSEKSNATMQ